MGLFFNAVIVDIAAILIAALIGLITYFQWAYTYWERKKVPFIKPKFPFGTSENPFTRKDFVGFRLKRHYDKFKSEGHKHGGMYFFARPSYLVIDPLYVKNVMSKDFQYFPNHGIYHNERDDPLSANLFAIEGQKWRNLRTKLTPCFTSGKMKMMFQTMVDCSKQLVSAVEKYHVKKEPVDIKDVLGCFTTDIIGSCAFGVQCNSFENPNGDFRKYGKLIFSAPNLSQGLKALVALINQDLARYLKIAITKPSVSKFFLGVVKDTVEYREKNNCVRQDFMQILINLKNSFKTENGEETKGDGLTVEEIAAQAFMFFAAGYETSSTTMTFCLFELANNLDIQERVRAEVNQVLAKYNGNMTYDAIMELKYMGQVIDETLRKYPPVSIIPRRSVKDYQIPDTDIILDKRTTVLIPALALHYDPEYFPDPENFNPERFSEENRSQIRPFTYLPFGEGPRICIGVRFGLMQTKVGLAALLKNYKFSLNQKTHTPLNMDPSNFILTVKGGIWLNIEKITN